MSDSPLQNSVSPSAPTVSPLVAAPAVGNTSGAVTTTSSVASSPRASSEVAVRERNWPRILGLSALALGVVALGTTYGLYSSWKNSNKIAHGIYVQGISVGGLTHAEAKAKLRQRYGRSFLEVKTPERPYRVSLKQLGGQPMYDRAIHHSLWYGRSGNPVTDLWRLMQLRNEPRRSALPIKWDKAQLRKTMWTVAAGFNTPARDARLEVTESSVQVIPDESGRKMNVGATLKHLQKRYYAGLPAIQATVVKVPARVTTASLEGQDIKLGEYDTYFNSGLWGRTRNIQVASDEVDGTVLMPGEVFSFNQCTGERTWDKGYRMAHIFETKPGKTQAEVVDGLAGGVCQVSSTLYNAVRKANNANGRQLGIVQRESHSLPVPYVPWGLDATVAWPNRDFKFRNDFAHPVYLRSQVSGSRLYITVWGRVPHQNT